jgi:hypothetical protein
MTSFARYIFQDSDKDNIGLFCGKGRSNLKVLVARGKEVGFGGLYFKIHDEGIVITGYSDEACDYGKKLAEDEFVKIKESKILKSMTFNIGKELNRDTFDVLCRLVRFTRVKYDQRSGILKVTSFNRDCLEKFKEEIEQFLLGRMEEENRAKNQAKMIEQKKIEEKEKEIEEIEEKEKQAEYRRKQKEKKKLKNFKKREKKKNKKKNNKKKL